MKAYARIQRSSLDFVLSAVACCLTVFSLGVSLAYAELGLVFVAIIAIGAMFSRWISLRFKGNLTEKIGLGLYIISAFASPFVALNLNSYLPAGGFPRELLLSAAPLTWMVAVGSFFTWRDQQLLFQCVPCIALFGLIGAFNTFEGATITFFVFMFCASILYARSHQRTMLDRATRSGYPKIEAIHGGPWRYMAGPEWGLLSAAIVIILSAVGAPIIRLSVSQVAGVVSIKPPQIQPPAPNNMPSATAAADVRNVGQGPIGRLSDRELFRIQTSEPRYLRVAPYISYDKGAWSRNLNGGRRLLNEGETRPFPYLSELDLMKNFTPETFKIRFSGGVIAKLPIPTPFGGMNSQTGFMANSDGTVNIMRAYDSNRVLTGTYFRRKPEAPLKNGPPDSPIVRDFKGAASTPPRVVALAREIAAKGSDNLSKALLIKKEIESRCMYNLNAEAGPTDEDPVDWFLFGPKREGYCDLFASAMVLMARAVDIPARYVVGYYPVKHEIDDGGFFVLRESDAHAWAEVYFDGVGWIPFDATEGAQQVEGGERGSARDTTPFYEAEGFWTKVAIGLAVSLIALLGWYWVSKKNAITIEQVTYSKLIESYEQHCQTLEIASLSPKWANESPSEYFHRVSSKLGELHDRALAANQQFSTAFYGPRRIGVDEASELERSTRELHKSAMAYSRSRRKGII